MKPKSKKTLQSRYKEPIANIAIPLATKELADKFAKDHPLIRYKLYGKLMDIGITQAIKNPKLLQI